MFHITITHDGKTEVDTDTKAIIGAYDDGDKTTGFSLADHASAVDIASLLDSAEEAIASVEKRAPGAKLLRMMAKIKQKDEEKDEEKDRDRKERKKGDAGGSGST